MPIIVSPHPNETGKIIGLLERLGGKAKEDFRFTYFGSQEALEVTEELYQQWQASGAANDDGDQESDQPEPGEVKPFALAAGVSTVAEHHTHSHTATLGRNSVAERNLHNYEATRDANTITPRTAHDQDDPPPPPPVEGEAGALENGADPTPAATGASDEGGTDGGGGENAVTGDPPPENPDQESGGETDEKPAPKRSARRK